MTYLPRCSRYTADMMGLQGFQYGCEHLFLPRTPSYLSSVFPLSFLCLSSVSPLSFLCLSFIFLLSFRCIVPRRAHAPPFNPARPRNAGPHCVGPTPHPQALHTCSTQLHAHTCTRTCTCAFFTPTGKGEQYTGTHLPPCTCTHARRNRHAPAPVHGLK